MLNLLPEEQKKKVMGEYAKRIWVTLSLGIIIVIVISSVFLVPVYSISHGTYSEAFNKKADIDKLIANSQKDTSTHGIKDISSAVSILKEYSQGTNPTDLLVSVVKMKPSGVILMHVSYTPSQNNIATIDISGKANSRAELVSFYRNLQGNPDFSSVFIPISNFSKDRNIDFSAKLVATAVATSTATTT